MAYFSFVRWGAAGALCFSTVAWGVAAWPPSVSARQARPVDREMDRLARELAVADSAAAAALSRLGRDKDVRAIATAFLAAESHGGLAEVSALARSTPRAPVVRLAALGGDPDLIGDAESREEFFWAHAPALEVLTSLPDPRPAERYLARLERAAGDAAAWGFARNRPVGLAATSEMFVEGETSEEIGDVRAYYAANEAWLAEVLAAAAEAAEVDAGPTDAGTSPDPDAAGRFAAGDALRLAYRYRPTFKRALTEQGYLRLDGVEPVVDPDGVAATCYLFDEFGELIRLAVEEGELPAAETLEVAFANAEFVRDRLRDGGSAGAAAYLKKVHDEKPAVWQEARFSPLALELDSLAPDSADDLLRDYGADDIGVLLCRDYEGATAPAAAAVHRFGDVAIYVLVRYRDTAAFREALVRDEVGPRLVPYVLKFGDAGLERLESNAAWLDKYFEPDGTERKKGWVEELPGGAAVTVARNWSNGHPNEWSELGWAALDVADASLLVASAGTSGAVTLGVRQGGKVVAKSVSRRQLTEAAVENTVARARSLVKGARTRARSERASLLRRVGGRFARLGGAAPRRWVAVAGERLSAPGRVLRDRAKAGLGRWRSVPPERRRLVYRSLLAAGLTATAFERTIPGLAERVPESAEAVIDRLVNGTASLAKRLLDAVARLEHRAEDGVAAWAVYFGVLAVLAGLTILAAPKPWRRRIRYV